MAKNNEEHGAMWRAIGAFGTVILIIVGWLFVMNGQMSERPCRAEVTESQKALKLDFEKRQTELKTDILRVLNEMKTDQKDALDNISAEQSDMKRKMDRLYYRFNMGGPLAVPPQ